MITDEQIDKLVHLGWSHQGEFAGTVDNKGRAQFRKLLEPILAAERNRLLDECLGICDMKMSEVLLACGELSRQEIRTVQAVLDMLKRKVEALRHE